MKTGTTSLKSLTVAFATVGALLAPSLPVAAADNGRDIGEVKTAWKIIGPDHKIKIVGFEDPDIKGVTCYVSRAVKGGITGAIGLATDSSDASVACRQSGAIAVTNPRATKADSKGTEIFSESRSILFKELHVTRHYDAPTGCWTYLTWSDKLIDGSPKHSLSAVCPQQMMR